MVSFVRPLTCLHSSTSSSSSSPLSISETQVSFILPTAATNIKEKLPKKTNIRSNTQDNQSAQPILDVTTKKRPKTRKYKTLRNDVIATQNNSSDSLSLLETHSAKSTTKSSPLKPITDLVLGSKISGTVVGMSPFGVFLKINYDLKVNDKPGYALLHKSQIQNEEITRDLADLFRVGQVLNNLRVITVNYAKGEVGLSLRAPRPKRKPISDFTVGQQVSGKVASITEYGAFVDIGAKVNPLLHISRITQEKITNIRDVLKEGDTVKIRIILVDEPKKAMSASMLSPEADEYLTRRNLQRNRTNKRRVTQSATGSDETIEPTELDFFQDAIRDLEKALGVK